MITSSRNQAPTQTAYVIEHVLPWDSAVRPVDGAFLDSVAIFDSGYRKECLLRNVSAIGATITGELGLEPGTQVSLELPTGQRPKATTDWVNGSEAGLRFDQPVSVILLINRQLLRQPVERRRVPRVEIRARAWVEVAGAFIEATVQNISSHGVQIQAAELPAIGSQVRLFVEGLNIPPAKVVWKEGNAAGLELCAELPWAAIILWIRELVRSCEISAVSSAASA